MKKNEMICSSCIYGEPAGSFGAIRCLYFPESTMKRSDQQCGRGKWREEGLWLGWDEWENSSEQKEDIK